MENPYKGVGIFVLIYTVATILFIPALVLTIGSGFCFSHATNSIFLGTLIGTVSSWTGAAIGAQSAFYLSRYVFRDKFKEIEEMIKI